MSEPPLPFEVKPEVSNHFAWMRTQMGLQRTLMAAVRTSVSLIGFGFTVAQFFEKVLGGTPESLRHLSVEAPRNLGLVLIAAGVLSLAVFTWEYHLTRSYLFSGPFTAIAAESGLRMRSPTYAVSFAVMLIGIAAFGSVLLRF